MTCKDKYCHRCTSQYTMKRCLFCFGGRRFEEIPKVDITKFCIKNGEVVPKEKSICAEGTEVNMSERCFTWNIRLAPEHIELLHKLVSKEYSGWFTGGDVPKAVEELANDVEELYNTTIGMYKRR